ncbi:MAG TPA: multidrug effflux MFS transporter, partial [Burkholderiaceae bacterium]
SGTLAMHIFVPALALAGADLHASPALMQMTVSVYIVGLALGQLVYGPLADRYGRRPMLMAGLALYTAAGLAAVLAPDAHTLIVARLLQALGGCAGLVLGRAIVRDTALPQEAAQRLAMMNLMVVIGPGVAPLIGGALAPTLGWRFILGMLCVLGIVNFICTWRLIPETGAPAANIDTRALVRHYRQLLGSPAFLGYAIGGGCATTAMYAFIAAAPFIFVGELHRPTHEVGIYLSVVVSGIWVGNVVASRLVMRVHMGRMLVRANAISVLAAFTLLVAVLTGHLTAPLAVGLMFCYTFGSGLASPAALTQAMSVNPHVTGSASGLYGCIQMGVGALCTVLAGLGDNPALAAALSLAGAGVVSQLAFWIATRASGKKA